MAEGGYDIDMDDFGQDHDEYDETSFDDTAALVDSGAQVGSRANSLQRELLLPAVDSFYDAILARDSIRPIMKDYSKFKIDNMGKLRLRSNPEINIVNHRTGAPLALSTISGRGGGVSVIRKGLGFVDYSSTKKMPQKTIEALQTTDKAAGGVEAALASENIPMRDLGQQVTEVSDSVDDLSQILGTMDDTPFDTSELPMREIIGLNNALQRTRGELTNNLAKLTELDKDIAKEKEKLSQAEDEGLDAFVKDRIKDRLFDLGIEREARLEAASTNREALRTQVNRIRETIRRIINENTTLGERLKTLFREQGITIASILTAIGFIISTLVLAVTGGGGGSSTPAPKPPPDRRGVKEWIKNHLSALGRALANLAGKAAGALPGIIGSIISWLLNFLSKTAGWLAENTWALLVAVGGLLYVAAKEWLFKNP